MKSFVMNLTKLEIFLQQYPITILITRIRIILFLYSIQQHKKQRKNDFINNYYSLPILNNIPRNKSMSDHNHFMLITNL